MSDKPFENTAPPPDIKKAYGKLFNENSALTGQLEESLSDLVSLRSRLAAAEQDTTILLANFCERHGQLSLMSTGACGMCQRDEARELAVALEQQVASLTTERDRFKRALSNHLCPEDMADWVGCAGGHTQNNCAVCDGLDRKLIDEAPCYHTAAVLAHARAESLEQQVASLTQELQEEHDADAQIQEMMGRMEHDAALAIQRAERAEQQVASLTFVAELLRFAAEHEQADCLMWNANDDGTLTALANCSDCFYWGCADAEEITTENFPLWKQTIEECEKLDDSHEVGKGYYASQFADELFCARVRKMRPQGASYPMYPPVLWPLFDTCGPVRETGLGNPKARPDSPATQNIRDIPPRAPSYDELREQVASLSAQLERQQYCEQAMVESNSENFKRAESAQFEADRLREALPDDLRESGWMVAVHNDYRLKGTTHTFWLLTKGERCVKGEGLTDADALNQIRAALAPSPAAPKEEK